MATPSPTSTEGGDTGSAQSSSKLVQVRTKATSPFSATVMDPVVLKETSTTREVAYCTITRTHGTPPVRGVEVVITHERKGPKGGWEPVGARHLSTLKAGECLKLELHSREARRLYEALQVWYRVSEVVGVKPGVRRLIVKEVEAALKADLTTLDELVKLLAKVKQPDLLAALRSAGPDITGALAYASMHAERTRALHEFERNLTRNRDEGYWQHFFERNDWIFGYGLDYRFLSLAQAKPRLGGADITGRGGTEGDFLLGTEGCTRFTVLVEVKRPTSMLLASKPYRNRAWPIDGELAGAVAQIQRECRRLETRAHSAEGAREHDLLGLYRINPRGIVVVGSLRQLGRESDKKDSFEQFRRNLANPAIVTYDELFERAKFIVEHGKRSSKSSSAAAAPPAEVELSKDQLDDIPF